MYHMIKLRFSQHMINVVGHYCNRDAKMSAYVVGIPCGQLDVINVLVVESKDQRTSGHRFCWLSSNSTSQAFICSCHRCWLSDSNSRVLIFTGFS